MSGGKVGYDSENIKDNLEKGKGGRRKEWKRKEG